MISICPYERISEVIPIGTRFFEYAKEKYQPNGEAFITFWRNYYNSNNGCLLIEEKDDEIKGFLGLIFYNEPWTGELVASEVCWYSEGREGLRLLEIAEKIAKACNAKILYVQHLNNKDNRKMGKIYRKRGFDLGYFRYSKEL